MPSPVGHALAGAALALAAERFVRPPSATLPMPGVVRRYPDLTFRTVLLTCVLLATLPDVDLLYQPMHRAITHSVGAALLVTIISMGVTGWVTGRPSVGFGVLCGLAWTSHIFLDWLGTDPSPPRGVMALWPFSDQWFISEWDVFRGTQRQEMFSLPSLVYNARTVFREIAILAPVVLILFALKKGRQGRQGRQGRHGQGHTGRAQA